MTKFQDRLLRAARLDASVYGEIEKDKGALKQAIAVVALSSVAAGIGNIGLGGSGGIFGKVFFSLAGWVLWSYLIFIIGTKVFPEKKTKADYGELLRTIGFSSSPGIIRVIGIFPFVSKLVFLISSIWMLAAMVVAVREALDYKSTGRAIGVCVAGWFAQIVTLAILASIFLAPAGVP